MNEEWERRVADAWAALDDYAARGEQGEAEFRALIDGLADEVPPQSGIGCFERASAFDSTGHSDRAVPLYRRALELGLDGDRTGIRRRRAVIQLASSLRNVGQAEESVALLVEERDRCSDELDDALVCVLALGLAALGREREGLSLVIGALSPHLPRYQRSMAAYARSLIEPARQD